MKSVYSKKCRDRGGHEPRSWEGWLTVYTRWIRPQSSLSLHSLTWRPHVTSSIWCLDTPPYPFLPTYNPFSSVFPLWLYCRKRRFYIRSHFNISQSSYKLFWRSVIIVFGNRRLPMDGIIRISVEFRLLKQFNEGNHRKNVGKMFCIIVLMH